MSVHTTPPSEGFSSSGITQNIYDTLHNFLNSGETAAFFSSGVFSRYLAAALSLFPKVRAICNSFNVTTGLPFKTANGFTASAINVGGMWMQSQPDRITIRQSGQYMIGLIWDWSTNPTDQRQVQIVITGAHFSGGILEFIDTRNPTGGGNSDGVIVLPVLSLQAGDFIQAQFYQGTGVTLNVYAELHAVFLSN